MYGLVASGCRIHVHPADGVFHVGDFGGQRCGVRDIHRIERVHDLDFGFRFWCEKYSRQIALGGIPYLLDTKWVIVEPNSEPNSLERHEMTYLEVAYRYQTAPGEAELRAIDSVREVYGIQRISFNEKEKTVRVLFDASRFKGDLVASLLRRAGIDVQEQLVLA